MTSKLIPSNPSAVATIRSVTPRISTVSAPFARFGRFKVGSRATIVKLTSGALAVFSPSALTPEVHAELERLGGPVRYLCAPDIEHHIFLGAWAARFPEAKILGPAGLPEKRAQDPEHQRVGVKFDVVWPHTADAAARRATRVDADFDADFDTEFVHAHGNRELVFNFRPERTLVQADLLFNLPATEQYSKVPGVAATDGWATKLFIMLTNTQGAAMGQQRFIWYVTSKSDRPSFAESMKRIDGWDFDRLIPCHGDVIETGAKDVFRKMFAWHLQ